MTKTKTTNDYLLITTGEALEQERATKQKPQKRPNTNFINVFLEFITYDINGGLSALVERGNKEHPRYSSEGEHKLKYENKNTDLYINLISNPLIQAPTNDKRTLLYILGQICKQLTYNKENGELLKDYVIIDTKDLINSPSAPFYASQQKANNAIKNWLSYIENINIKLQDKTGFCFSNHLFTSNNEIKENGEKNNNIFILTFTKNTLDRSGRQETTANYFKLLFNQLANIPPYIARLENNKALDLIITINSFERMEEQRTEIKLKGYFEISFKVLVKKLALPDLETIRKARQSANELILNRGIYKAVEIINKEEERQTKINFKKTIETKTTELQKDGYSKEEIEREIKKLIRQEQEHRIEIINIDGLTDAKQIIEQGKLRVWTNKTYLKENVEGNKALKELTEPKKTQKKKS